MERVKDEIPEKLECLLMHTPKFESYYKPIGECILGMSLPMGLLAIADWVNRHGYKTKVIHLGVEWIKDRRFSLRDYLAITKPKVIGLSLHWHFQSYEVIQLARKIRLIDQNIFIILGGLTSSYYDIEIMENFEEIDGIIRGDAEIPFLSFMEEQKGKANDFSKVPNFTWRKYGEVKRNEIDYTATAEDMDKFNFTNFSLLKNHSACMQYIRETQRWIKRLPKIVNIKYFSREPTTFFVPIVRGCLLNCSYCGGGKVSQKIVSKREKVAIRSISKIMDSIIEAKKYGFERIYINGDFFSHDYEYLIRILEEIHKRDIGIHCVIETRPLLPQRLIVKFKEIFGKSKKSIIRILLDSASEKVRMLNKGHYYSNKDLFETLYVLNRLNINVEILFFLGRPQDSIKNIMETYELQRILKKKFKCRCKVSVNSIDPASPSYIEPEKFGIVKNINCFADFYTIHKKFPKDKIGYYIQGYFDDSFALKINSEDKYAYFETALEKIRCKYFCPLYQNLHLSPDVCLMLSKSICKIMSLFWKAESMLRRGLLSRKEMDCGTFRSR